MLSSETATMFYCVSCNEDLRMIENGTVPDNPCYRCGAETWEQLTRDQVDEFRASQNYEIDSLARVFFCMRRSCKRPVIMWAGDHVNEPCICGSKMFEELIGPNRAKYLATTRRGGGNG